MAPLEVSRSKLSRHLQGLVFRCHKCTFTCSSDQALQLHLQKHAEVKPYQCQLCYYDGSRRRQLEEHLRVEHKVGARRPRSSVVLLEAGDRLRRRSLTYKYSCEIRGDGDQNNWEIYLKMGIETAQWQ